MKSALLGLLLSGACFGQAATRIQSLTCATDRTALPVSIGNKMYCFTIDPSLQVTPPTPTGGPGIIGLPPAFYIYSLPAGALLPSCSNTPTGRLLTLALVHGTPPTGTTPITPGTSDMFYVSLVGIDGTCNWVQIAPTPPGNPPIWDWYGPPPGPTCGPGGAASGFGVGLGQRVYVQAVAGVSGDAWFVCGQNAAQAAAGTGELVPLAAAP